MSTLRDQIAHDISKGQLTNDANEETAADRIGALARTDPLGAALWRVTGNLDAGSFIAARGYLIRALEKKFDASGLWLERIAQKAMEEWMVCLCPLCNGHKHIHTDAGVKVKCPECDGSGKGKHSHEERMRWLQCGPAAYSKVTAVFEEAHLLLTKADARVDRQLHYQLGHSKSLKGKSKG